MPIRAATDTKFLYYPVFHRVIQHSADGGKTLPTRVVSSTRSPFDFSSAVDPGAVTVEFKIDNGAWVTSTIDLSSPTPSGGITAVTAAELASAINVTDLGMDLLNLTTEAGDQLTTESDDFLVCSTIAGWRAAVESSTDFFKLFLATPGSTRYVQVRGELAELTGIAAQIFKGDTQKAFGVTQSMKASERIETTDSTGMTTAARVRAYRMGSVPLLVDTAMSKELRAAIEGGSLITAGFASKQYDPPGPDSFQPVVSLEAFFAIFAKNENQAAVPVGYLWNRYDSCKGTCGDIAGDRNAQYWSYTFEAVPYRDPVTGISELTDEHSQELTPAEYAALDVFNV